MNVTFADYAPHLASSRLRAAIPQRELAKLGIHKGWDVLVYGKHWLPDAIVTKFGKRVYDVCDDHFDNEHGHYYRRHIQNAHVVTCNSFYMQRVIKDRTGRDAIVVREPYEGDEQDAAIGDSLLWFGHQSNLPDFERVRPFLTKKCCVLSNHPSYDEWTPERFRAEISKPCIVIIPTGKSRAKSENRMVEAVRNGRYVCAEYLPAYEEFEQFFPLGDIPEHIDQALAHPEQSVEKIRAAQDFIRDRYSPAAIAKQWLEVLNVNF